MALYQEDFTVMSERTECSNKSRGPNRANTASGSVCNVNRAIVEDNQDEY